MKIQNVAQGTPDWLALRAKHYTASEASAMMGVSKKISRSELLRMKATGDEQEFSRWVQENLLDKGHEIEAQARPIAEKIIGEELYPATALDDDGYLLASYDGLDMMESVCWECKSWNEEKAAAVRAGEVPEEDYWQVVQQLAVGTDRCLYMVTDGTEERTVHVWKEITEEDYQALMAGWEQFADDLANYQPAEVEPAVTGTAPDTLPALRIELTGMVTASNLAEFKTTAMAVIDAVNTDLQTDTDFADAEKAVKWCKDVEQRLGAAKDHALSQTASIDDLFRALDEIKETARSKRLNLEKLVKARKQAVRDEILMGAKSAYVEHIEKINGTLGGKIRLPDVPADFAGAMKGKKTVASLRDAVDTELARVKIESNQLADKIRLNLETLRLDAAGHEHLFADAQQLVMKEREDLQNLIKARIDEHKEAEQKRLDAEREKIRAEEEEKAKAAAAAAAAEQEPAPSTQPDDTQAPVSKPAPTPTGLPSKQSRVFSVSVVTDELDNIMADRICGALSAEGIEAEVRPIRSAA